MKSEITQSKERLAILIRHGESEGNAGLATDTPQDIPLTLLGRQQAQKLASSWSIKPDLIVTSPFIRAKQTAEPMVSRFKHLRVEEWPIGEFTYLTPADWHGSTSKDRQAAVTRYWQRSDPTYNDGAGAESFVDLIDRVEKVIGLLRDENSHTALLFTHEQFMKAFLWCLRTDARRISNLRSFKNFSDSFKIPNCGSFEVRIGANGGIAFDQRDNVFEAA